MTDPSVAAMMNFDQYLREAEERSEGWIVADIIALVVVVIVTVVVVVTVMLEITMIVVLTANITVRTLRSIPI